MVHGRIKSKRDESTFPAFEIVKKRGSVVEEELLAIGFNNPGDVIPMVVVQAIRWLDLCNIP